MSATETAKERRGFAPAPVQAQPGLACLGYVDDVPEGKVSGSQKYVVQGIGIKGIKGSRGVKTNLLYRPEWLRADFDPAQIEQQYDADTAKGLLFVYRKMFGTSGRLGALEGLCGSTEKYYELSDKICALPEVTTEAVWQAIREFFIKDNPGTTCGYILKQRRDKLDELDADGKQQYALAEGYEVSDFFVPNEKGIEAQIKRAAKSEGQFRVAFEVD